MKLWWIERMAKHDFSFHILCSLDFFSSFLFSVLYLFQSPHMLNALFCAVEKKNQQQRQRQRQHSSELLLSIVSSNIWCTSIKNTNFILKKHFDIETKAVIHIIYSIVWQYRVCLCSLQLNRRAEDWQCIKGKRRRVNSKKKRTHHAKEKNSNNNNNTSNRNSSVPLYVYLYVVHAYVYRFVCDAVLYGHTREYKHCSHHPL